MDSRAPNINPSALMTASDPWCGMIVRVAARELEREIFRHFANVHPEINNPAPHVTIEAMSQPICDVCLAPAQRPWWNHTMTPPMDKDFTEPNGTDEWLVCTDCHEDLRTGNVISLVKRWVRLKKIESPYLFVDKGRSMEMRAFMAGIFSELILRSDGGQLEEAEPT